MTSALIPGNPVFSNPLTPFGWLYFYVAGTTTPQAAYSDATGVTPLANPLQLDSNGQTQFFLKSGLTYKVNLVDVNLYPQPHWPVDNIIADPSATLPPLLAGTGIGKGGNLVGFEQSFVGSVPRTSQAKLAEWVTPEDFGAIGDGTSHPLSGVTSWGGLNTTGWSLAQWQAYFGFATSLTNSLDYCALQAALNSGNTVRTSATATYVITKALVAMTVGQTLTGGGTISLGSGFAIDPSYPVANSVVALNIEAANVTIDAVTFEGVNLTTMGTGTNAFIWCVSPGLVVTCNAKFQNLNAGANANFAIGCNQTAAKCGIYGAYFYNNPGSIFFQGPDCVAVGNRIFNPHDVSIALNGMSAARCVVSSNLIDNMAFNMAAAAIGVEEGASSWVISNNNIYGLNSGVGINTYNSAITTQVHGGVVEGNLIQAGAPGVVSTNPMAFMNFNQYYQHILVKGNRCYGMCSGPSNNTGIIIAACDSVLEGNFIDTSASSYGIVGVLIGIGLTSGQGLTIRNNTCFAAAGGTHSRFSAGDYQSGPVSFEGGKFYGGGVGIDLDTYNATIHNINFNIRNISDNTATTFMLAVNLLGERCGFFNSGCLSLPHSYWALRTSMYCNAAPTAGGGGSAGYYNGDTFSIATPTTYFGYVRASGAWHSYGAIV